MEMIMKKIGILTSGGDAPGMNACIRAAVRMAIHNNLEIYGIRRGYRGMIEGDIFPLDRRVITNIIHQGGTVLETARAPEFEGADARTQGVKNLQQIGIEGLILIGGDGTFRGGTLLASESDISIIGVPGTIDNDIYGTDYTIGFDTAINTALEAIDRIRDTARSHERLFFVEVMGHHTGFIALESGIAGGAEELLIPESPLEIDELCSHLVEIFYRGKKSAIVIVAETDKPGNSFQIANEVKDRTGFDSRVCILGHVQRGGRPTAHDRILASRLGIEAVQALIDGKSGYMVGEVNRKIVLTPLRDTWQKQKSLHKGLQETSALLRD
jgi:6-phosphofructokinase 1